MVADTTDITVTGTATVAAGAALNIGAVVGAGRSGNLEVDGQGEKEMEISGKYHQAKIVFDDWIWNGEGPYTIVYRIYNSSGEQTAQKTVRLFVKH